ncbi:MAG TPA: hypothetical protein VHO67_16340 [Polyangia bacterium]|nr:hypothetical protein [Polyangia bacterium]
MRHRKSLPAAALTAALLLCAGAREAAAQLGTGGSSILTGSGGSTGAANFAASDFFVGIQAQQGVNLTTFESSRFFNIARCQCNTPVYLFISLQQTGFAKRSAVISSIGNTGTISAWIGSLCNDPIYQGDASRCRQIASEPLLTFLNQGSWELTTDARSISTYLGTSANTVDGGTTVTGACNAPVGTFNQVVQVLVDYDGDGNADLPVTDSVYVDLQPPPAPTGQAVQEGNEALIMKWNQVDQAVTTDLLGYQILCSRADYYQVFKDTPNDAGGSNGPFPASFVTCPATQMGKMGIEVLDPTYACSPLLSAISTSYRVEILQNDITYAAAVVAIDNSGNASQPTVLYGKPRKTASFYDVYRDGFAASNDTSSPDPGGASGGFCAVGVRRPGWRSGLGAIALVGLGVALGVARRRRRGRR